MSGRSGVERLAPNPVVVNARAHAERAASRLGEAVARVEAFGPVVVVEHGEIELRRAAGPGARYRPIHERRSHAGALPRGQYIDLAQFQRASERALGGGAHGRQLGVADHRTGQAGDAELGLRIVQVRQQSAWPVGVIEKCAEIGGVVQVAERFRKALPRHGGQRRTLPAFRRTVVEAIDAYGSVHGLRASRLMTSKCGALRSRLRRLALTTPSPAAAAK